MEYLISLLISVIGTTVVLSFLFWRVKPRIEIGDKIAVIKSKEGKKIYKFKFINKSKYAAFDVNLILDEVSEIHAQNNEDGVHVVAEPIPLTTDRLLYVSPKKKKVKRYADNCITVRVLERDLHEILKQQGKSLVLRITVKHGFSNLSGTFERKYNMVGCIKPGDFTFGNNIKIE